MPGGYPTHLSIRFGKPVRRLVFAYCRRFQILLGDNRPNLSSRMICALTTRSGIRKRAFVSQPLLRVDRPTLAQSSTQQPFPLPNHVVNDKRTFTSTIPSPLLKGTKPVSTRLVVAAKFRRLPSGHEVGDSVLYHSLSRRRGNPWGIRDRSERARGRQSKMPRSHIGKRKPTRELIGTSFCHQSPSRPSSG
jgi:hypothetical protein